MPPPPAHYLGEGHPLKRAFIFYVIFHAILLGLKSGIILMFDSCICKKDLISFFFYVTIQISLMPAYW